MAKPSLDSALVFSLLRFVDALDDVFVRTGEFVGRMGGYVSDDGIHLLGKFEMRGSKVYPVPQSDSKSQLFKDRCGEAALELR